MSAARRAVLKAGWTKAVKRSRAWIEVANGD